VNFGFHASNHSPYDLVTSYEVTRLRFLGHELDTILAAHPSGVSRDGWSLGKPINNDAVWALWAEMCDVIVADSG